MPDVDRTAPQAPPALLVQRTPGRRTLTAGVWLLHGSAHDPDHLAGATHLLEHLTLRRCGGRDRAALARLVDRLGGEVDAWTSPDMMGVSIQTTVDALDEALALLVDAMLEPTFDPEDVELERRVALVEAELVRDDPAELADQALLDAAWGRHPLARPVIGWPETVGRLDPDVLRQHHRQLLRPGTMLAAVCGDVDEARVARGLARLPLGEPARLPLLPPVEFSAKRLSVSRRGAEQVHARVAFPALAAGHPQVNVLAVLNRIVGVGASSRLFQRLREEAGLTYDISSGLILRTGAGMLEVAWACAPEAFPDSWRMLREELERLAETLEADEVEVAVRGLLRGLAMDLEDPGARCALEVSEVVERGRRFDPRVTEATLAAVDLEAVRALAREILRMDRCAVAACGPPRCLERVA